jgi:chemotaxis protein CheD
MLSNRLVEQPPVRSAALSGFEAIQRHWDKSLNAWVATILPGEFYITHANETISTVIGSCVCVCVRDTALGVGGMNHFMLPDDASPAQQPWIDNVAGLVCRYGSFRMESLINGLLKVGAQRARLEVKLFGGRRPTSAMSDVGARNVTFVQSWLKAEGMSIVAEDVGLSVSRRIAFTPSTGKVRVKHLRQIENQEIERREHEYLKVVSRKPIDSDIELF